MRKSVREFDVGDIVWNRLPGMDHKLSEAWSGPWEVVGRLNAVNYKIKKLDERGKSKVVHINTLKACVEREGKVRRLTVVAESEEEELAGCLSLAEVCPEFNKGDIDKLLEEFPHVLRNEPGNTGSAELKIEMVDEVPVQLAPYRIPDKLKLGVKAELDGLLEAEIISSSTSPYASPIVPVTKPDGSVRMCVDYRKLNEKTVADPYYMATLDEIVERVGQSKVLSKIDLAKGYYQVRVAAGSKEKTAFISPYGKYEFSRMPFGLRNAPAVFQRMMDSVLGECYDCSATYIDDIIVFSEDWASHLVDLRKVLGVLGKHGLTAKPVKCSWGRSYVQYLGHMIGGGKMAVPSMRAKAMAEYKRPVTKKDMQSFLGCTNYYRKFVKDYCRYSAPLHAATALSAPGKVVWTEECLAAFNHLRLVLCEMCVLTVPGPQDVFSLHTEASVRL